MAKWIKRAVKHPGIEKDKARKAGISTHEELEKDAKKPGKAGDRGCLGLFFERLAKRHKK